MRGYGRDYDNRGNWMDRAEETVRGWFGAANDYDREYGPGNLREWPHRDHSGGMMSGGRMLDGYHNNNWSNTRAGYDNVYRAGGYYGADYDQGRMGGGNRYDRDMSGGDWQRGRTYRAGGGMGGMNRGYAGGMNRGGMGGGNMDRGGMNRGGPGGDYGASGNSAGNEWGDYNRGGWGGDLYRRSNSGGVEPGRHFRGYGHGSTSGSGYEPF